MDGAVTNEMRTMPHLIFLFELLAISGSPRHADSSGTDRCFRMAYSPFFLGRGLYQFVGLNWKKEELKLGVAADLIYRYMVNTAAVAYTLGAIRLLALRNLKFGVVSNSTLIFEAYH